jgi:cell division protein FtsI (penicillin-binding protein 3)
MIRFGFLTLVLAALVLAVVARMAYLQVFDSSFLRKQSDLRVMRSIELEALRGIITDRHGEPLAVSTPVDSIWVHPESFLAANSEERKQFMDALNLSEDFLKQRLKESKDKEFVYIERQMAPTAAQEVMDLNIPGVNRQREYRRYYPGGEATSHVVGVVNIDGKGVEGVELLFDKHLTGQKGAKRVMKDRRGRIIQDVELLQASEPGRALQLSIDNRLQYLAYRELKAAVTKHKAAGGSLVLLDVKSGEVLAIVNQPSYNPNNRRSYKPENMRNRAITDVFEPGSVIKAFSILSALEANEEYTPDTIINTNPGQMQVHNNTIRDMRNYGELTVRGVLRRSSNVGTAQMVLSIPQSALVDTYMRLGFGEPTYIEFPGERSGYLETGQELDPFSYATLSFGYSLSTTAMQLAKAFAIVAQDGTYTPLTLLKRTPERQVDKQQVLSHQGARTLREMLLIKPDDGGSGQAARVNGYHVAGKTGTARKVGETGYMADRHISTFAGFAPALHPRLVCVVVIDDPRQGGYYGGAIAAPVFANVMRGALRLMDIPLDDESAYHVVVVD